MHARRLVGLAAGLILFATAGAACSKEVATAEQGDCIEELSFVGGIDELPTVDCDEAHDAQVVGTFDHEGDDFPGEDALEEEALEQCQDLFEDFVGAPVQETSLGLGRINPSEESWNEADDRETICVASLASGQLDQSVEDAAEDFEAEASSGGGSSGDDAGDSADEDTSLEDFADLVESCEDGDLADCDTLWSTTPSGSEAEAVAETCGGEDPEGGHQADCVATLG